MDDLELVAVGVFLAGSELMADRSGDAVNAVVESMIGVVARRARVSTERARLALERASKQRSWS